MKASMHERLRQARESAGFRSAAEAARHFGWPGPTYAGHENGARGLSLDAVERYAQAFRVEPGYIAFGQTSSTAKIADVPEVTLIEVLRLVLGHPTTRNLPPDVTAELVVEICKYVNRSGSAGLSNVIDFQLGRMKNG